MEDESYHWPLCAFLPMDSPPNNAVKSVLNIIDKPMVSNPFQMFL